MQNYHKYINFKVNKNIFFKNLCEVTQPIIIFNKLAPNAY